MISINHLFYFKGNIWPPSTENTYIFHETLVYEFSYVYLFFRFYFKCSFIHSSLLRYNPVMKMNGNLRKRNIPEQLGFLSDSAIKNLLQYRRHRTCGFDPWIWKIPWRRKWQLTPVSFPGESHGQRSLRFIWLQKSLTQLSD